MKVNKYAKLAQKHLANGHSIETVVAWWNRLVGTAEIKDGKATFYFWSVNEPMKCQTVLEIAL